MNRCAARARHALALVVSTLLGLVNGAIVVWSGIPSFITTLGTMLAYRGIARGLGGSDFAKYTGTPPLLFDILNGPLNAAGNFRLSIVWFVLLALLMWFVLTRTRWGNWIYAVGGNPGAALAQGCLFAASLWHFTHRPAGWLGRGDAVRREDQYRSDARCWMGAARWPALSSAACTDWWWAPFLAPAGHPLLQVPTRAWC